MRAALQRVVLHGAVADIHGMSLGACRLVLDTSESNAQLAWNQSEIKGASRGGMRVYMYAYVNVHT